MNVSPWLHSRAVPAICPKCKAPALLRSHAQTRIEKKRKELTGKRPWRCHICGWRGWFEETQLNYPSSSEKPLPPQIAGSDVPIPDFRLDGSQHRPEWSMKDNETDFLGNDSGANDSVSPARGGRVNDSDELSGAEDDLGERRFAVFGIEIPEEASLSDDNSTWRDAPPAKKPENKAVAEPRMSGDNADDSRTGAQDTGTQDAGTQDAGAQPKRREVSEMTVSPPEFSEQSGRPVSVRVSEAFHHEARNKSWPCRKCGEFALYRSRARTLGELLKKQLTRKRPYRCHRCGWRGWLMR